MIFQKIGNYLALHQATLRSILLWFIVTSSAIPLPPIEEAALHEINVNWNPSHTTSFNLNIDGFLIGHFGLSSCIGLIWNSTNGFIRDFTCNLDRFTSVMTELQGLLCGQRLTSNLGINFLIVEMGFLLVVGMVKSRQFQNHHLLPLLQQALYLMDHDH